jgi:phosphate transport system permease protein
MPSQYARRVFVNRFNLAMSLLTMAFRLAFLFWILFTLFAAGSTRSAGSVHANDAPTRQQGGLLNAIVGSARMAAMATLIRTPVGIFAHLSRRIRQSRGWFALARFINDILLSAPSIIIGLFIYEIYVFQVGHFSAWAGSFALALIVIPVVIRTTENMLRLVPDSLREAAVALGTPRGRSSRDGDVAPRPRRRITGVLLASRAFPGRPRRCCSPRSTTSSGHGPPTPMANLPVVIFQFAMSPYADWQTLAWGRIAAHHSLRSLR